MYGRPSSSVPTSKTRATCSLFRLTAARASRMKRPTTSACSSAPVRRSLSATLWSSLVRRRDDDAHAALAEHALDAVLPREELARGD